MGKANLVSLVLQNPTGELNSAQQRAAAVADQVRARGESQGYEALALPTDLLAEQVPSAQPPAAPTGSPESLARIGEATMEGEIIRQDPASETGVAQASEIQAVEDLRTQLASERTQPHTQTFNPEEGVLTLPFSSRVNDNTISTITDNVAKAEFVFTSPEGAATKKTPESSPEYSALQKLGLAQAAPAGRGVAAGSLVPAKGTGAIAFMATLAAMQSLQTEKQDPTADIERRALAEAEGRMPAGNVSQELDNKRHELLGRVADVFEHMTVGTPNFDPVTGESTQLGKRSNLTNEEKLALGDWVIQNMKSTGVVQDFENDASDGPAMIRETLPKGINQSYTYHLTPIGMKMLGKMGYTLEQIAPNLKRPVSLTPLVEGRLLGQTGTAQKQVTRTPKTAALSSTMLNAMDVMSQMPNIISTHKLGMVEMMIADIEARREQAAVQAKEQIQFAQRMAGLEQQLEPIKNNKELAAPIRTQMRELRAELKNVTRQMEDANESPFAALFGMDAKTRKELTDASYIEAKKTRKVYWDGEKWMIKGKTKKDPDFPVSQEFVPGLEAKYADDRPKKPVDYTMQSQRRSKKAGGQLHADFADEVMLGEFNKAKQVMSDATARQGQVFYYGATAIGNSGRLMVSQTELNYQSNKLARFLVDNPRATGFVKGGDKDTAFHYLAARAMLKDADRLTRNELIRKFKEMTKDPNSEINQLAVEMYQANQEANPTARAERFAAVMSKVIGNPAFPKEWEGNGEWGFPVDALHEWGKYQLAKDGQQLHTRLKVEVDGINNGSSIQGMQFGDRLILQSAGILYDTSTGNVLTDDQNLREVVFEKMIEPDDEHGMVGLQFASNKTIDAVGGHEAAMELLRAVKNEGKVKSFIKIPLMTTIYGKPADMHRDHARKFVIDNREDLNIPEDMISAATELYTKAIAGGLRASLTKALVHQDIIKHSAGWMWGMMDIIPEIEGANGYMVQFGQSMMVEDSPVTTSMFFLSEEGQRLHKKTGEVKTTGRGSEVHTSTVARRKNVATAATPKKEAPDNLGAVTRNHLAVSGTHNIDSTVAQETLIRAKKEIPNFWGQQVFDAFIGDLNSIDQLMDIANETFFNVNRRYNMLEAEFDAYKRDRKAFNEYADRAEERGEMWDIRPDGKFQVVSHFIKKRGKMEDAFYDKTIWDKDPSQAIRDLGVEIDEEGNMVIPEAISPKKVKEFIQFAENHFIGFIGKPIKQAFADEIKSVNAARDAFMKDLRIENIRQFN